MVGYIIVGLGFVVTATEKTRKFQTRKIHSNISFAEAFNKGMQDLSADTTTKITL
jgi:hypothetical protein